MNQVIPFCLSTVRVDDSSRDGPWFNIKCQLASIGNPILEIRRTYDCLISNVISYIGKTSLYWIGALIPKSNGGERGHRGTHGSRERHDRNIVRFAPPGTIQDVWVHYIFITVTSSWARWRLISLASRLFTQPFIQAQIKENIKAPHHWYLSSCFMWQQLIRDYFEYTTAWKEAFRVRNIPVSLWTKIIIFWIRFHWNLFLRVLLTICQLCCR